MTETDKIIYSGIKILESKSKNNTGNRFPSFNAVFKTPYGEIATRGWRVMGGLIHPPSIIRGNGQAPMQIVNVGDEIVKEMYEFLKAEGVELSPDIDDAGLWAVLDAKLRYKYLNIT